MDVLELIWRELNDAEAALFEIKQIRVSTDALRGSPTTVMFSPERVRATTLFALPSGVVADLGVSDRWREVLIHPADWIDALKKVPEPPFPIELGPVTRVFGITVRD